MYIPEIFSAIGICCPDDVSEQKIVNAPQDALDADLSAPIWSEIDTTDQSPIAEALLSRPEDRGYI